MKRADYLTNLLAALTTAIQPEEFFQWICLGLTIISVALSIGFTIYQWYRTATADGKISAEEAQELVKIVDDAKSTIERIEVKK